VVSMCDKHVKFVDAAIDGDVGALRYMLEEGTRVNCVNGLTGRNAFHEASAKGFEPIVRFLMENGVNIHSRTMLGRESALHLASASGQEVITKILLKRGCRVNDVNRQGDTPLHLAATDSVGVHLLSFGADPFLTNKHGQTPVQCAYENERESLVKMYQKAQEEQHRKVLSKERERRAIIRARHKEMDAEDKKKLAIEKKAKMKADYMRFRHKGSKKKKSKSIFHQDDE
jgi:ankyrin repeat protein